MTAAGQPQHRPRGAELLIEHCAALDREPMRSTARERLERVLGGTLANFLLGALTGTRRPRAVEVD